MKRAAASGNHSVAPLFWIMQRHWLLLGALALATAGCNWLSLSINARSYPTLGAGDAGNLVVQGRYGYVTLGDSGFGIVDAASGARVALVPPPTGTESVDDVALDGALLFVLDARPPGHVSLLSLAVPERLKLIATRDVPVGPFSGVTAARGLCIVSGGTSALTVWAYDSAGLAGPVATADLGRGQPDALLARDAGIAFVSTHYRGPYFGLSVLRVAESNTELLGTIELPGAGFTEGGSKPANFPIESAQLDDHTLLVALKRGLAVVDVGDPSNPFVTQVIDVGGPAVNVDVRGSEAAVAVAGGRPGVALVTFAPGARPQVRRMPLPPGTNPGGVAFSDDAILVAAREKGVLRLAR